MNDNGFLASMKSLHYRLRIGTAGIAGGSSAAKRVWSLGYALASDVSPFNGFLPRGYSTSDLYPALDPRSYIGKPKDGDVVWVASRYLPIFVKECLPRLGAAISLIVSDGDEGFPSALGRISGIDVRAFIEDRRILTVFAQNSDGTIESPKINPLPIGLDFHTINRKGGCWGERRQNAQRQEAVLEAAINDSPPIDRRIPRAFVDFNLSDRRMLDGTMRSDVLRAVGGSGCVDLVEAPLPRSMLWQKKGRYAFSISPHGNGLDCHRTWEDLALGCVVIVRTSALDPLYEGLPVAIVNDWSEVTPGALEEWMDRFRGDTVSDSSRERLRLSYWMDRIRAATRKAMMSSASRDEL